MPPKWKKTLEAVLSRRRDENIPFDSLRGLFLALGFRERIRGGHHIFERDGIEELVVLQTSGSKAKGYQVKQARNLIERHSLDGGETGK